MRRFIQAALVIPLVLTVCAPTSADPIAVIGGTFTFNTFQGSGDFSLRLANGSSLIGRWPNGVAEAYLCIPCAPGTLVTPNAVFSYDAVPAVVKDSFATANGMYLQGEFLFSGPAFPLPPGTGPIDDTTQMSFVQPFRFTGHVTEYAKLLDGPFEPSPGPTFDYIGSGSARMKFLQERSANADGYTLLETKYEFTPTPEPASVLLVAAGLATLWRGRKILRAPNR